MNLEVSVHAHGWACAQERPGKVLNGHLLITRRIYRSRKEKQNVKLPGQVGVDGVPNTRRALGSQWKISLLPDV